MKREMDDVHRTKTVGKAAAAGRVVPLSQLTDYKVAEGDPDVRGWEVVGADGSRLGTVDDLLVDTAQMKVRYLDVELDRGASSDIGHADRERTGSLRERAEGDRALGREGTYATATATPPGLLGAVGAAGGSGTPGMGGAGAGPVIGDRLSGEERLADASARAAVEPGVAEPGHERLAGEQQLADASAAAPSGATADVADVASHLGTREWAGDDRGHRGRHVLIPIGTARLDEDADRVLVQGHGREHLHGLPEYGHGELSREDETALRRRFGRGEGGDRGESRSPDADFYADDLYDADRFYGPRRGAALPGRGRS